MGAKRHALMASPPTIAKIQISILTELCHTQQGLPAQYTWNGLGIDRHQIDGNGPSPSVLYADQRWGLTTATRSTTELHKKIIPIIPNPPGGIPP